VAQSAILVNQKWLSAIFEPFTKSRRCLNATGEYRYTDRKDETVGTRRLQLFLVGLSYQR